VDTAADRFWANVDRSGDHYYWLGFVDRAGTPQARIGGRLTTARRAAWELRYGALPRHAWVVACPDDPTCVRVEHLSLHRPARPTPAASRQRRRRGTGSMLQRRPGVWKLTATTPTGRAHATFRGSTIDAETALETLTVAHGAVPATVDQLVGAYLTHLAAVGRAPSTQRRYRQLWRQWLAPRLGHHHPDDVQRRHVERCLAAMDTAGQSSSSVHQAAVLLSGAYQWAGSTGRSNYNPAVGVRLPDGTILAANRRR
jgi:hypothetical protein